MKQGFFLFLAFFMATTATAQFKSAPVPADSLLLKNPYLYQNSEKVCHQAANPDLVRAMRLFPEASETSKCPKQNLGNALLTASVGAALGVAGVCGGLKGSNGNRSMAQGGLSLTKASGHYFKQAQKQRQESVEQAISPENGNNK